MPTFTLFHVCCLITHTLHIITCAYSFTIGSLPLHLPTPQPHSTAPSMCSIRDVTRGMENQSTVYCYHSSLELTLLMSNLHSSRRSTATDKASTSLRLTSMTNAVMASLWCHGVSLGVWFLSECNLTGTGTQATVPKLKNLFITH